MSQYVPTYDSFAYDDKALYVPTQRLNVLSSVYLPSSDVDPRTGVLKPERQRRCRTQGKMLEIERLNSEEQRLEQKLASELGKSGPRVSMRLGLLIIAAIVVVCGFYTLAQLGEIAQTQKDINRNERSVTEYKKQNDELEAAIAEASDFARICFIASQELNMVPASTAEAIHLVAADSRPMEHVGDPAPAREIFDVDIVEATNGMSATASSGN